MDKISAFIDGESGEYEGRAALARFKNESECREAWAIYHMIGDAMRGERALRHDFTARVCGCLDGEPTVLAPRMARRHLARYALSAAASVAAVVFVLTLVNTTGGKPGDGGVQLMASNTSATPAAASAPIAPRAAPSAAQTAASRTAVNEYLMAHQEFSPSTTLQGMAPYIRTVAADGAER